MKTPDRPPPAATKLAAPKVVRKRAASSNSQGTISGAQATALAEVGWDWNVVFHQIYMSAPHERIEAIRRGVPAEMVGRLSKKMEIPKESLIGTLGLSRATLSRKERERKALSKDESERILGVQALIGQVEQMVRESGDPSDFNAAKWVSGWLDSPLPALGGHKPAAYMDTIEGQKLVSNLLAMAQTGAYA